MPNDDKAKSMWRDVSDADLNAGQGVDAGNQGSMGADTRGPLRRGVDAVRNWWDQPSGVGGTLDRPPGPTGYGPTQGDVVSGVGKEAMMLAPQLPLGKGVSLASKAARAVAPRALGALGGAGLGGWAAGEAGIPRKYGSIPGAVAGAVMPDVFSKFMGGKGRLASKVLSAGGEETAAAGSAPSEGSAIVTPAQQAEDVGRFYAGGGPGGGQGGGPNPYVTEQNRRLIQKIIDEGRNPPGVDPMLKSARRHYTKGSE